MNCRAVLLCWFLCSFATQAAAQQPNGRIDLDVVSAVSFPLLVIARVSFAETDNQCPEDRGMLRIFGGTLALIRPMPTDPPPTSVWRATTEPIDDETQRYRAGTSTCQMDIAVRQQVRREGSWESLLVPRRERPSLPPEERRELQRQFRWPMPSRQQKAAFKEVLAWQGANSWARLLLSMGQHAGHSLSRTGQRLALTLKRWATFTSNVRDFDSLSRRVCQLILIGL
jgi:hypothetical protein